MFETNLNTAIYRALTGDSALSELMVNVVDLMPQDVLQALPSGKSSYPLLVISEISTKSDDTTGSYGFRSSVVLDVYSVKGGKRECQIISGHVRRILHDKKIFIDGGYNDAVMYLDECRTFQEPDGKAFRANMEFNSICLLNSGVML